LGGGRSALQLKVHTHVAFVFALSLIDRRYPESAGRSTNLTTLAGDLAILWFVVFALLSLAKGLWAF